MIHTVLYHYSIPHAKVFIFAPKNLQEGNNTQLELNDPTGLSPNNTIKWTYHVAPIVSEIDNQGNPQIMVIDPSLNSTAALPLNDWFNKMKNSDISKYMIVTPDAYFFLTKTILL